jgi:hypothetical protein
VRRASRRRSKESEVVFEGLRADAVVNYAGEWVGFMDGQILAHGPHLKDVIARAEKKAPRDRIWFMPVPAATGAY